MYVCVLQYMSMHHMCAVPKDTRRGHQLQVAVSHSTWVMETEPEFSPEGRAASVLNSEPSQQPLRHTALVPSSCTGFFFIYLFVLLCYFWLECQGDRNLENRGEK